LDKATLLASTPEETSTGSSSDEGLRRPGLARSRTAPAAAVAKPKPTLQPEVAPKERRAEVTTSQIGLAITTLSGSESDASDSGKVRLTKGSTSKSNGSNGPKRLARPPPNPMGRSRSQSVNSSQSKLHNPFADPSDSILNHSSGSNSQELGLGRRGSENTSEESLAAIRRISRKFPALPMAVETGGKVVSLSEVKKTPPSTEAGSASNSSSRKTRNRSLSQPQLVKLPGSSANIHPISPTNSTDGDVAIRTRRRLRTHLDNISPPTSIGGTEDLQQSTGTATAPSTATSLFSGRFTGNMTNSRQASRSQDEQNWSPVTPYTVDSIYSDDEYSSNVVTERPIGHIARRALGIEKFLGEEKEKLDAVSSDGHGNNNDRFVNVIKPDGSRHNPSVPVDVSDIQAYRASDVMFLSPTSSTYRVRPRSNVDSLFPMTVSARSTMTQPSPRQSQRGRKRSGTTESDAAAREAFAAAWRTVVPNVASPSVSDLKNVNSVKVKKTPTLIMHRQVLSGTSMLVDEGYATHPTTSMTSLAMMEPERGRQRSGSKSSEGPMNDRDLVRKARKMRAASVDSEVY
ncbi:5671_t:CDS:1, partial [Acaulospora colombiana]